MVDFSRVKVPKISETIVGQIEELILEGALAPGDKLPAERELAEQFEVSRPSLREALGILESKGLIRSRRGGGTYVCDATAQRFTDPLSALMSRSATAILDVIELRQSLEVTAAFYAAKRATDTDRAIIAQRYAALSKARVAGASGGPAEDEAAADTAFHLAIAEASHNLALIHVMRGLYDLLRAGSAQNFEVLRLDEERHARIHDQHTAIYEAVASAQPEAAREAAMHHLTYIEDTLRENLLHLERDARSRRRAGLGG